MDQGLRDLAGAPRNRPSSLTLAQPRVPGEELETL